MGRECLRIHSEENKGMDQLLAASSALCRKEGDYYVGFETPLEGAEEISQCTEDLKVFHAESIPMIEDLGKLWRFRSNKWSIKTSL